MRVRSYRRHSSGNARVTINGKDHYLGKHGTKASREKYNRLIAEYKASRRSSSFGKSETLMQDILLAFIRHAKTYDRRSDKHRGEVYQYKLAIRPVTELYGTLPADQFGPASQRGTHIIIEGSKAAHRVTMESCGGKERFAHGRSILQAANGVNGDTHYC
jgi:hypothetical protein